MKRRNLDKHSPFNKTGHTSKGDQRKWKVEDRWYKADYMGYESLATKIAEFAEPSERIQYLVEEVEKLTGINAFGKYITAVLEIDAFFLNEDRHTNNLAVVYNENTKQYSFSPIFDQGLCLFADTRLDYPLRLSLEECMKKIQAKPFSTDFDEQLDAAEALYGVQVQFDFSMKDLENEITRLTEKYSPVICERIQQLMRQQFRKYKYLIKQK